VKTFPRIISKLALAAAALAAFAAPASASIGGPFAPGADHVVFVQTDNTSGNAVVAYDRAPNGTLTQAGTYLTGGVGGILTGSVVDHTASQGSLTYDSRHGLLYAVNAGSNSISVFIVRRDRLFLEEVLPTGGDFPVSVAVHGDLVYVLNARSGGSVQGFRAFFNVLIPLPGSSRPLGLDPTLTPEFVNTPGQVAFSPNGSQLLVTTKANGSNIDVFGVRFDGRLSATPVVNNEPGAVPFAVSFDAAGHVVATEAGPSAVETFSLASNGALTPIDTKLTGQAATCWVAEVDGFFYASNAGSGTVSSFSEALDGTLTPLALTPTDGGTVDAAASPDGRYLYVQTGAAGIVDEFRVNAGGSLSSIGSVTVPNAVGGEGIVAA
jgi:6-phosphogluconolactonase (cycloisomerase 2 family)